MGSLFGQGKGPPGGLSINTAAANTAPSQPAPSASLFPPKSGGGLFGGSSSTATSAGTLFGASTTTTTQGGSLFGNTATAPSQAGTLFGGAATATPTATTSLFGNPTNTQQAAPSGGSLFGGNAAAPTQALAANPFASLAASKPLGQPAQGGNLFGSLGASQPQQTTSLFGSLGTTAKPQQTGSLFGTSMGQPQQQQQPQPGASLFGGLGQPQNQQQQPNAASSLFGASAQTTQRPTFQTSSVSTLGPGQQPQRSIFSASIGQYTQAAQTVPGVRISLDNLRPTTRFEDLHEDLQNGIAQLDAEILRQVAFADECAHALPAVARTGETIPADVAFLEAKLDATRTALITDATAIDSAKQQVRADARDAQRSFHTIAAVRMPSQLLGSRGAGAPTATSGTSRDATHDPTGAGADGGAASVPGLVPYFAAQADAMATRLSQVQRHLAEVEAYLAGLEAQTATQVQSLRLGRAGGTAATGSGIGRSTRDDRIRELAGVLRDFESGILTVAASVGQARERVQEAQLAEDSGPRWRR